MNRWIGWSGWPLVSGFVDFCICKSLNIDIDANIAAIKKIAGDFLIIILFFCTQSENYFCKSGLCELQMCSDLSATSPLYALVAQNSMKFISVIKTTKLNFAIFATLMSLRSGSSTLSHSNEHKLGCSCQRAPEMFREFWVFHGNWF